ncbi:MAG: hypothetical protein EOO03_07855 [Chitinophagaceae bacterium]|nr:MAG: hypothetical protein EOO03_07855 [Chitinophagaceae bacterium]
MKTKNLIAFSFLVVLLFSICACKKDTSDTDEHITWTFKGAEISSTSKYIMASGDSHGNFMASFGNGYPPPYGFVGKIHPVQVGTFTIGPVATSPNWLSYRHPGFNSGACSGTVTITKVANSRVWATFDLQVDYSAGPVMIKGSITNLLIR